MAGEKDDRPLRALTQINDKILIQHTLELLAKYNVKNIFIATNNQGKAIEKIIGGGQQLGLNISYVYEDKPLGTAGAINNLKKRINNKPFFVIAGDTLTEINLTDMAEFHNQYKGVATMAVKPRPTKKTYDNVFMQGNKVVDFQASTDEQSVSLVNAGIYIFEPEIFAYIPSKLPSMLEQDVFPKICQQKKLFAFTFQGIWFDVSSDKNYMGLYKS